MISLDHAAGQIAGVWKMALGDERWRDELDRSMDGVFHSFWAIGLAAPLTVFLALAARRAAQRIADFPDAPILAAPLPVFLAADLVSFAAEWSFGLVLLLLISRAGARGRGAGDLIVGYNWIQPLTLAVQLPPVALMGASGNMAIGGLLSIPALAISLALYWGVIRRSLATSAGVTIAIIMMLTFTGILADSAVSAAALAIAGGQS